MGIGDWANPQSPIPNPQSPVYIVFKYVQNINKNFNEKYIPNLI